MARPKGCNLARMRHPKDVGDRTTLAVVLALRERGYIVAFPFGENTRYDLLADDGRQIQRAASRTRA